jgi:hypothetical protein
MYRKLWANTVFSADSLVSIESVRAFWPSRYRIPKPVAEKIYRFRETGMGYYLFTLKLVDGRDLRYQTGDFVDFVNLPYDVLPEAIIDAEPYNTSHDVRSYTPQPLNWYKWCIYSQ